METSWMKSWWSEQHGPPAGTAAGCAAAHAAGSAGLAPHLSRVHSSLSPGTVSATLFVPLHISVSWPSASLAPLSIAQLRSSLHYPVAPTLPLAMCFRCFSLLLPATIGACNRTPVCSCIAGGRSPGKGLGRQLAPHPAAEAVHLEPPCRH